MKLPTYKGYTVDYRLKQFRRVTDEVFGGVEFIGFKEGKGDKLLCEMLKSGLVPNEQLGQLL